MNVSNQPFIVQLFDVRERAKDIVLLMEYVAPVSGCTTAQDWIVRKQGYNDRLLGAWAVSVLRGHGARIELWNGCAPRHQARKSSY